MATKHPVYDSDTHFSINPITRALKNEGSAKATVIQHDHNSERVTFDLPRHVDGHDISLCNVVEVHYNNIDAKTKMQSQGIYEVDDMQISTDNPDLVVCSWLISQNATKYVGSLNFLVRFSCTEDDGTIVYAWNTAIYSGIQVANGIYNSDVVVDEYADVLEEWRRSLVSLKVNGETLIIQGTGANNEFYQLNPITGENPRHFHNEDVNIDAFCSPSHAGVYTISGETDKSKVTTLPADVPNDASLKLTVEGDWVTNSNKVFQTLRARLASAKEDRLLIWTRQHDQNDTIDPDVTWSKWRRLVSAEELTDGTVVPKNAQNAFSADEVEKADKADVATYDSANRPLNSALNYGGDKGNLYDGYKEIPIVDFGDAGSHGVIESGIISFIIRYDGYNESVTHETTFIVDVRQDVRHFSCVGTLNRKNDTESDFVKLEFIPFSEIVDNKKYYKHKVRLLVLSAGDDDLWEGIRYNENSNCKVYYKHLLKHRNGFAV